MHKLMIAVAVVANAFGSSVNAQVVEEMTAAKPKIVARGVEEPEVRWIGLAVSRQGRVFTIRDQDLENKARITALNGCERRAGSSCRALAVPPTWGVVAVACTRGGRTDAFLGGSADSGETAEWIAHNKAVEQGFARAQCRKVFEY